MKKVQRFEDLKIGDKVTVLPCGFCGGQHTGEIVRQLDSCLAMCPDKNGYVPEPVFAVEPGLPCSDHPHVAWGIVPEMIGKGIVFTDAGAVN